MVWHTSVHAGPPPHSNIHSPASYTQPCPHRAGLTPSFHSSKTLPSCRDVWEEGVGEGGGNACALPGYNLGGPGAHITNSYYLLRDIITGRGLRIIIPTINQDIFLRPLVSVTLWVCALTSGSISNQVRFLDTLWHLIPTFQVHTAARWYYTRKGRQYYLAFCGETQKIPNTREHKHFSSNASQLASIQHVKDFLH